MQLATKISCRDFTRAFTSFYYPFTTTKYKRLLFSKSYYNLMKSSISAKIPTELYDKVQEAIKEKNYTSNTECIIEGLTLLLCNPAQEDTDYKSLLQEKEDEIQNLHKEVNCSKEEIHTLQEEVKRSKEEYIGQIKSLEEKLKTAPELGEFSYLQARVEELQAHKETLKKELDKASLDKEDLKTTYNNYFLQVQSLINQKSIEAPGAKKPWWRFWS